MPDDPPLSSTVTETTTIDTGADKESIESLNANFADFWKEKDSETDAPEAPGEGAAQETKEFKERPRDTIERPEPHVTKDYTDEDFDKLDLPSDLAEKQPQIHKQFKDIKALWHADRVKAVAEAERAAKLEADLAEARKNSLTPEAKADYEHAAAIRRRFDFASDPEFIQKFHQPVHNQFQSILNEAVEVLPDRQAAQAWAKYISENYSPDQLDRQWWLNSVAAKIPNELDRTAFLSSVTDLLKMQKERDGEIARRTNDKSSFDNWIQEKDQSRSQYVQKEVMDEIGIQEQKIKEILKKDPSGAKTTAEREAIEKHNERFDKLNGHFQETMKDLTFNGPRAMVRAAVEATRARYIEGEYELMEKRAQSAEKELEQLKKEMDRITGARRRISNTTGTPPSSASKDKNGGLSIKDLDVRRSFEKFDWGDNS